MCSTEVAQMLPWNHAFRIDNGSKDSKGSLWRSNMQTT